jgi:hypothetical protein
MKKNITEEAYYERLRNLADTKKISKTDKLVNNLGTLVDYKSASDGINYGIIKENHNYYIKVGGKKTNPDVSDFAYIGGLSNITDFQYKSLAEAEKQRNMIFQTISDGISHTSNKKKLNENNAKEEIEASSEKVDDLDAATDAAEVAPETEEIPEPEIPTDEVPSEEMPSDDGAVEAGDEAMPEIPVDGTENPEAPADGMENDETGEDVSGGDLEIKEIEKSVGKLTNKIRNNELTPEQTKSFLNSLIASFKDKLPELELDDRKKAANKILKVEDENEPEDVDTENPEEMEESEMCSECGGFAKYAESRGYTKESIMECDNEEMTNLVSGYANAHNDGMNDGNFDAVALFVNPEVVDSLKNDYGHEEYAEKLTPHIDSLNETTDEDKQQKIDELWGGLSQLGKKAGEVIGNTAKKIGQNVAQKASDVKQAIGQKVGDVKQAVGQKVDQAKQAVGKTVQNVKQAYYTGEKNAAVKKAEELAINLGNQLKVINANAVKAGQEPININSVLTTLKNQLGLSGKADLSKLKTAENVELASDSDNLGIVAEGKVNEISPELVNKAKKVAVSKFYNEKDPQKKEKPSAGLSKEKKSEVVKKAKAGEDIGKKGKDFGKLAKSAAKEYGSKEKGEKVAAAAMWKNVKRESVETEKKQINETESKIRKYVRRRLEEKMGKRKASLNENKKSETLKKLDKWIDEQYEILKSKSKK